MKKMTFQRGMAILQAAFPAFIDEKTAPVTVDVYWRFLYEIPDERFEFGVSKHIREKFRFPTIAELLQACDPDHSEADALNAWTEVMQQISSTGSYGVPKFSDPITAKAVLSIGGWKMLCLCETARIGYHREAFFRAFKTLRGRDNDMKFLEKGGPERPGLPDFPPGDFTPEEG